jgi:DNA-directed RNA polymerase specialized sigma24 family protein
MLRESQRTVSYDSASSGGSDDQDFSRELARPAASPLPDPEPDPQREGYLANLDRALSAAIGGLLPREQIILSYYYVDELTLAEIGRILHEHESTISRQLGRIRRQLRERVTETLVHGSPALRGGAPLSPMSIAQIELAFEYAIEDFPFDLSRALSKTLPRMDES